MKKLAIVILLVTQFVWADEPFLTHVYQLKYAEPKDLVKLLSPYVPQFGGNVQFDDPLKALAITTRKDAFPEIEQIIKQFDVPPPPVLNIDVTIYLMSALGTPSSSAVPPELEPVVKQLKNTLSYKGYQLIDTEVIRVRAGQGGEVSGVVNGAPSVDGNKTISQVKFFSASISTDEKGRAIRIDSLKVGFKIPVTSGSGPGQKQYQYIDTGINTNVDVREGQKVVVGKSNMDGSDRASIVILMAKVVE
jgi:type II/III secretion system protein